MKPHYLVAIAAVAAALLLRYLLNPVLGPQGPYLILTLPIVAAAVYGGFGPALLATALGTTAGTYLFIDRGAGLHDVLQPENLARTLLFVVIGLAVALMGGRLERSRAALADKVRQLKSSNRAKDNAMAVLGHEIRNPLSAIHSAQTVLQRAPGDEDRVARATEIIGRQVAQMTRMADDLLDLSGVMRGAPPPQVAVDLHQVLLQALEQSAPLYAKKGHRLDTRIGDAPVAVTGDAQRLVQVFANLLTNAAKYTDPGGEIALTLQQKGTREVTVTIADNGVGLPPGLVAELFEPFVQAPGAASNAEGGLGLGLAIVRKIVTAHRGDVTADSAGLGQGSRFTVVLPLAQAVT
ncbi:ATP-binding protein [Sphingomonas sp. NCPPB 2930]